MPGFVDEVTPTLIRGWYVDPGRPPVGQRVVISVNGEARYCALCQDARPDVVAAGITHHPEVGFRAPLALQIGDLVRVRALDSGRLLGSGLAVVMPETAPDGWLSARAYGDLPAFRAFLQPLASTLDIQAFRPLFGHRGNLSALCVRTPDACHIVYRARPRHHAAWLERLHRRVLEPNAIAAPSLNALIPEENTASLMVENIDGQALGSFPETSTETSISERDQAYRDTIASVLRLSRASWPDDMRGKAGTDTFSADMAGAGRNAGRRGRHALNRMIREACLSTLKRGSWRELGLLLRMTRTLYRLPRVFAHGDLHPHNVLIETHTGRPVFIDWDHAGMLPPGLDLSRLLLSVPPALAESWIGDDRAHRLGWLILTYFAQLQRQPDFHTSEAGVYLRRRFNELTRHSRIKPKTTSSVR
ncbi:aminoglycoside phosphotransferase family protein [Salinicola halimionae]|uniref:aminoglycoside phosphotransferase family protein n=1 Tax=Salinicola halimionae TaxID=1949081 RepID=UPI000DA2434E|nr:aminoglycoside phosphotransferase family protein [Salinicola halimionae]